MGDIFFRRRVEQLLGDAGGVDKKVSGVLRFRMWRYYLLSAAGSFRARHVQLWQLLYSHYGVEGQFKVPRAGSIRR